MHLKSVTFHPDRYPTREHYPFTLDVLRQTSGLVFRTPVTLFVGENGTGKSTLLEALALKAGIFIWKERDRTRFEVNPYEETLHHYISVQWTDGSVPGSFFGASVFQDFARILDEWAATDPGQLDYFGGKSLLTQSHGQSIMSFFKARYAIKGHLLDEPETALSPRTQMALLDLLAKMTAAGHAQFIIATHSPILLSCPGATIYSFDQAPIAPIPYEQTDHYKLYKAFMADPHTPAAVGSVTTGVNSFSPDVLPFCCWLNHPANVSAAIPTLAPAFGRFQRCIQSEDQPVAEFSCRSF